MKREAIIQKLKEIAGEKNVQTDTNVLKEKSGDRFKKYQRLHGIHDNPTPAAVVMPTDSEAVSAILKFANDHRINVVPRNGSTATEGGLETWKANSIVIDCSRMNKVIKIDPQNMQATVQCGVVLEDLEDILREQGLTTGHSPQSKPLAQFGGLTATRSIGQFSTLYGGIEDMIVGLEAVFPDGHIARIKNVPRRSAGPDIRQVVIGNEGTLCVVTELTVKIYRFYPENHQFHGYLVENMEKGLAMLREVIVNGYRPSVSRLYSEEDARQHFAHFHEDKCVLLFMAEGPKGIADATSAEIVDVCERHGYLKKVDSQLIADWFYNLNWPQSKIDEEKRLMLEEKHTGFTTEVSADWENVIKIYNNVMKRVRSEFPRMADITMLGGHSSHSYINGTNMYFVYDYTINCDPADELHVYHKPIHTIIIEETLKLGGSMCHHHGIGKHRTQWTMEEHGSAYYILEKLKTAFDPKDIMNYGSIFHRGDSDQYQ